MPIIPKLECRVETFREDDAVFMRIGIHQEEMLLAYYALNISCSGKVQKVSKNPVFMRICGGVAPK